MSPTERDMLIAQMAQRVLAEPAASPDRVEWARAELARIASTPPPDGVVWNPPTVTQGATIEELRSAL